MDFWNWTWLQLAGSTMLYLIVLSVSWLFYTTRRSTQARARAGSLRAIEPDLATGGQLMTFEASINLRRSALAVAGPPLLLFLPWLVVRIV